MSRVFDPIVMFEIWGRLGADWRTNPGSFSKEFSAFFSNERPTVGEYESALAALKDYQAEVDKRIRLGGRHRHADRADHGPAHRRPHRRHEDPAEYVALQRRRHTRDISPDCRT